jgi:hypothetical protein
MYCDVRPEFDFDELCLSMVQISDTAQTGSLYSLQKYEYATDEYP